MFLELARKLNLGSSTDRGAWGRNHIVLLSRPHLRLSGTTGRGSADY